jgi:hypothetical protein
MASRALGEDTTTTAKAPKMAGGMMLVTFACRRPTGLHSANTHRFRHTKFSQDRKLAKAFQLFWQGNFGTPKINPHFWHDEREYW